MPYVNPTPAQLKTRFPAFAAVDDTVVQGALDEAAARVDQTWREKDFQPAQLLYAAHILTLDGQGAGQEAQFSSLSAAGVQSIKIASLQLTIAKTKEAGASASLLKTTSFGRRFWDLMRLNFPAVAVTNGCA